jgi:hypothetical protein
VVSPSTLHVDSSNVAQRSAGFIHICRMTIVTYRHRPKRPAKPAQIKVPRIVQHTPRGRAWKLPVPDDPEAKARAVAFLERVIRPRSS